MLTKPSWFKTLIRILLACIIIGTSLSKYIPIDDFYFGTYNTAWFCAVVAVPLILFQIGKQGLDKKAIETDI
jgi:hypothetical protein